MKLSELLTELNNRISAAKISGFWTDDMKKSWINTAVERICNWRNWKCLEMAWTTITKKDQDYYDEPSACQNNSIFMIKVDGDEYIKKIWSDFQQYVTNENDEKIFASHNGYYFLNPTPDTADLVIDIYGIKKPTKMVGNDDEPDLESEFEESIVKLALAVCLAKSGKYNEATAERVEVEHPETGLLARIEDRRQENAAKGFCGKARSSRWMM